LPKGVVSAGAVKYKMIRTKYPNLPKKMAAELAGYSPHTHPVKIDAACEALEVQRQNAIADLGITIRDQLEPLVSIRDNPEAQNSDRINAVKTANSMLPGYVAPEEKSIKIQGLFVELKDVSTRDIAEFLNDNGGGAENG
jgi:hypothetical protein